MSARETMGLPDPQVAWRSLLWPAASRSPARAMSEPGQATRWILRGGFPEPALDPKMDARLWHSAYVQTYLERDLRSVRAVGDLSDFRRFLFALAGRTGSLVNFEDLARDLGITGKTVRSWISVLEAGGQTLLLKPYHVSLGKRLVKRPKIYFLDTGTLGYLLGLEGPDQVLRGVAAGPMFEAAVLGQLYRLLVHRGEHPRLYFWRTADGHEVDFLIDDGTRLIPIEAKVTATPSPKDAAGIERFLELFGNKARRGLVVCLCRERHPLTSRVDAVPFGSF